jgi:hypothetical protein
MVLTYLGPLLVVVGPMSKHLLAAELGLNLHLEHYVLFMWQAVVAAGGV